MEKFVQCTFVVLLFSAISIGTILAVPSRQGSFPEMVSTEADYALFIAKKEKQLELAHTPKEKKLALAEMPEGPSVNIRGKIVMPDGSPPPKDAPTFYVDVQSYHFTFSQSVSSDGTKRVDKNMTASASSGGGGNTKKDGTFQIDGIAPLGSNVILSIYCTHPTNSTYRQLLSEPVAFIAHPGMKPLEITLKNGIPVRGKITYPNGSPVAYSGLSIEQHIEPALGADIPDMQNWVRTSRWTGTDAEGNHEIFLLSSEYTVRSEGEEQMLMIAETDTEKKLDWTRPMPVFVEIKKQDGSLAGEIRNIIIDDENTSTSSASARNGAFAIPPATNDRRLYVVDEKLEQGTLETITPEMIGKTMQFTLKPTSKVTIKLVDTSGRPLVDKRVSLFIYTKNKNAQSAASVDGVLTDSEGKAAFRVAPGQLAVYIDLPGSYKETIPTDIMGLLGKGGTRISNEIEKELDLAPGETLDVGTVRLTLP